MIKKVQHTYDIIIVGAGGAGLMAALKAKEKGFSVAILSKVHPTKSHTVAAQGGINAALGNVEPDDWRWHMYDTIKGSDWLADQDAVEYMCKNAASSVLGLANLGVNFSRNEDGSLYQRLYGGQSTYFGKGKLAYRACAANDQTGRAIIDTLYNKVLSVGVEFFNYHFAFELIIRDGVCVGVASWAIDKGEVHVFTASKIILATGGYGQVYRTTTAANICTGDGNAMAALAGIPLQDMEFVQFHPTAIPEVGILITEAARAEGGYLVNSLNEKFMGKYSPQFKDLACRDVVARAIATEITEGRGVGDKKNHVWLYVNHLNEAALKDKLPNLLEVAQQFANCNADKEPIPVAPAAHYTMGGIPTNIYGEVMPGLMAIGETACVSVHGANRLGCNSLLDIIVFAESAINRCHETIKPGSQRIVNYDLKNFVNFFNQEGEVSPTELRKNIQDIMQNSVGMFRNQQILENGLKSLLDLAQKKSLITDKSLIWNNHLLEAWEARFLLVQAIATCYAALQRKESRGAHYRTDFQLRDDQKWLRHSLVKIDHNFNIEYKTKEVNFKPKLTEIVKLESRSY